jgi:hypothetical protein
MNIKSLLLASAAALTVAVAAGNAVAGNYDFRDQASASMNAPVATRSMDAPKAAMRSAGADAAGQLHGNITPFVADKTPSTLTRAEVRAETIKFNNSAEGRAARARDIGGAQ